MYIPERLHHPITAATGFIINQLLNRLVDKISVNNEIIPINVSQCRSTACYAHQDSSQKPIRETSTTSLIPMGKFHLAIHQVPVHSLHRPVRVGLHTPVTTPSLHGPSDCCPGKRVNISCQNQAPQADFRAVSACLHAGQ